MHAQFEMTEGKERLRKIISEFPEESPHWSEAQNRFKFIDRLLTECLGWEKPDIDVEEFDEGGGRSDYKLGRSKVILEAKREALHWGILPATNPNNIYRLRPQIEAAPQLKSAVLQIIPYCALEGAQVAAVCNGPQLAIFLSQGAGKSPLDGYCYIFNGFASYLAEFSLLWSLLSPEGVAEDRAHRKLSGRQNIRIPAKASDYIADPRSFRYRSELQEELRQLGGFLLEEIEDNPDLRREFYKECYVTIEANNRNLLLSKQTISSRYARVDPTGARPSTLDYASKSKTITEASLMGAGSRPIVVIGDVGVGKSSFFENLLLSVTENESDETIFLNIDLGISATLTDDIKAHIVAEIPEMLYRQYGIDIFEVGFLEAIYHKEIQRFDNHIDGQDKETNPQAYKLSLRKFLVSKTDDRPAHIRQSLAHLANGRGKRVILIIDNADQRTFEIQQDAFLIAQEFAAMRAIYVFVALRPSTFYLSKMSGALSAYQNKILTISPPPADEVIERRLSFALRVAEGRAAHGALDGIRLNLSSIVLFLRAMLRSVRANKRIQQFLGNITGGNTKSVIELVTGFVGSPNVEAKKIVDLEDRSGDYLVPYHEFTKHALLGSYRYFNPESSLVACNLFDISLGDEREHFLKPLIVAYCASNSGARDNDGFFPGEDIEREMKLHGFEEKQIAQALRILANKKLIETPYSHYREVPVADDVFPTSFNYRATSVGLYHIRFWMGEFSYLDAMSIDTPIFDQDVRSDLAKWASSFEINIRLRRTERFRDYLLKVWIDANFRPPYLDYQAILQARDEDFETVRRVVDRHRQ